MTAPMRWRCDVCGEWLAAAEGYVVWHSSEQKRHGFQIVHTGKCDDQCHHASSALVDFLGEDGLSYALSLMSVGPIRLKIVEEAPKRSVDPDEFVDLVRRLHVPMYEEARKYFESQTVLDDYHDASESAPYRQKALKNIANTGEQED